MTKDDYVIICGDFGGVWFQEGSRYMKQENYWLDWLNDKPFTTLFADGNHENFDRLKTYPVRSHYGGKVHEIRPSVFHLMRGEVFCIDGVNIFAFGGASSHDIADGILNRNEYSARRFSEKCRKMRKAGKLFRVNHESWWEEELPSNEEMLNGLANLERAEYNVDFIISHSGPQSIINSAFGDAYAPDRLTEYFDRLAGKLNFKQWIFGHYHENLSIMGKYIVLYEQMIRIN